jgi:dephospho-CoA kinase
MPNDDDPLNDALGVGPNSKQDFSKQITDIVSQAKNDSAKEDFTFSRANIRELISNGNDAIASLSQIANQTQEPRAFEVLAKLMDSMVDANEKLLQIQKQIRELDKADMPHDQYAKSTINNNLYVASTAELQKMLDNINK